MNIVGLYGIHKTEKHIYLVLEYCAGGDMHRFIRKHSAIDEATTRFYMRQLASGLEFLWRHNLIHRDLKPQNLLLTADRRDGGWVGAHSLYTACAAHVPSDGG